MTQTNKDAHPRRDLLKCPSNYHSLLETHHGVPQPQGEVHSPLVALSVLYSETPAPLTSCVLPFIHSPKPNLPAFDPQAGQALCCLRAFAQAPPDPRNVLPSKLT